jgi:hypothetical protein
MRRLTYVAPLASALAGRAQSEVIVLRHPITGEIQERSRTSGASFSPIAGPCVSPQNLSPPQSE